MNKVPLENLQEQYKTLNFSIKEKEDELKQFKVNTFVLNPKMVVLVSELKTLNDQRESLIGEIIKAGGKVEKNGDTR